MPMAQLCFTYRNFNNNCKGKKKDRKKGINRIEKNVMSDGTK